MLEDNRDNFGKHNNDFSSEKYLIQTCSQAKMNGTGRLLEVHGVQKGSRRRKPDPINQAINQSLDVTQRIPRGAKIVTGKTNSAQGTNSTHDRLINNNNPFMPDIPLHPGPLLKSPKQQNA